MRGKDGAELAATVYHGITPAYAGKREHQRQEPCEGQDHPRVCGEKSSWTPTQASMLGSPPHMRGKAKAYLEACFALRITPAHAGKSAGLCRRCPRVKDHPRVCGKRAPSRSSWAPAGITPAHAGKSPPPFFLEFHIWDHPRICGEKSGILYFIGRPPRITPAHAGKSLVFCISSVVPPGSPPHMRGKGQWAPITSRRVRITPAHAGKKYFSFSREMPQ